MALYDCFVIDDNGFATVLEYCPGPDLERYLKQYNTLKESEARSIIIQVYDHHRKVISIVIISIEIYEFSNDSNYSL